MCGILGFIGKSKNEEVTYDIATALFAKTQKRGDKASGVWAVSCDNKILYHKEPISSSEFVKGEMWNKVSDFNANMLIAHCREPSKSIHGQVLNSPSLNKNNHPFMTEDGSIALVHNGNVPEYHQIKDKYKNSLRGSCDSEVLLHMIRSGEIYYNDDAFLQENYPNVEKDIAVRLQGIAEVFTRVNEGALAVAFAQVHKNNRRSLWLFRNNDRPLFLINLLDSLGQLFFCSEKDIWKEAMESTVMAKHFLTNDYRIRPVETMITWVLRTDLTGNCLVDTNNKLLAKTFIIEKTEKHDEPPKEHIPAKKYEPEVLKLDIISVLDKNDEVLPKGVIVEDILKEDDKDEIEELYDDLTNKILLLEVDYEKSKSTISDTEKEDLKLLLTKAIKILEN